MNEQIVRFLNFPETVRAVTCLDHNGDFNIYINAALTDSERSDALAHELRHIQSEHFYLEAKPIEECENEANGN